MVALQLFVALVILLTLDGAHPQGNVQCASKKREFCYHVTRAYLSNEHAKRLLKTIGFYRESMALHEIDYLLLNILKKTDEAELFSYTDLALNKEAIELTQLSASCTVRGWENVCDVTNYRLVEATVQLVKAIKEIAEEEARTIATRALQKYEKAKDFRNQSIVDLGIILGSSVAQNIYKENKSNSPQNLSSKQR